MESSREYKQDLLLGIGFSLLAVCAAIRTRMYYDPSPNGRIISVFYILILVSSTIRAIWFFIPSYQLEGAYSPQPEVAFVTNNWFGYLISELFLVAGSISLYSVFILVICYWAHMLKKVDAEPFEPRATIPAMNRHSFGSSIHNQYAFTNVAAPENNAIDRFIQISAIILIAEGINISSFIFKATNAEEMILGDSILLSVISIATLYAMSFYSYRIRVALKGFAVASASVVKPQINRIIAITLVANCFFLLRVAIEVSFTVKIIRLMRDKRSFSVLISDSYWDDYILIKHSTEIVCLLLQLMISTAMRRYDQTHNPRAKSQVRATNAVTKGSESEAIPLISPSRDSSHYQSINGSSNSGGSKNSLDSRSLYIIDA